MFRLLSRPGLLTGLVVSASVVSGVAFGAAVVSSALAVRFALRTIRGR